MRNEDTPGPMGEPARADRGRTGPFLALIRAAAAKPEAARALAEAYGTLDPRARMALVEAIVADANRADEDGATALLTLLAAEEDLDVATVIFATLRRMAPPPSQDGPTVRLEDLESKNTDQGTYARWSKSDEGGAALFVRPLYGAFVETLGLRWSNDGIEQIRVEALVHQNTVTREEQALCPSQPFAAVALGDAVDRLTPLIWRHLKRGQGHADLGRFAELFSPRQRPCPQPPRP